MDKATSAYNNFLVYNRKRSLNPDFSAITAYCLVAIIEHDLKLNRSTIDVLRIFSMSLLDKTPIRELFKKIEKLDDMSENNYGKLSLNF